MVKQPRPKNTPDSPDIAKLAEVVQGLTHQVRQLALILDEVREELVWAVRNDKFNCAGASERYVASLTSTGPEEAEEEPEPPKRSSLPPVPVTAAAVPTPTPARSAGSLFE